MVICSKGNLQDVYAALVLANGALMEGIKADMFFTFFGLAAIQKDKLDHLHTSTVGNPAFMEKIPTMVLGLPGFEALASHMMKKEMDKLDKKTLKILQKNGNMWIAVWMPDLC